MTNWISVSKMKYWVQKVLPLVYDDSLSYYELLNKVVHKLNQVIENNENIPDYVAGMIQEFITSGEIESVLANVLANYILNVKNPPEGLTPATGDGSADDTEAIQGCINYANANGGMAVYFPSGAYLTGSLDIYSGTTIFGYDRYNTRIVLKGGATRPLINGDVETFTINGICLDGNMDIQVNNINVIGVKTKSAIITNAKITDGYILLNADVTDDIQLNDIIFDHSVVNGIHIYGEGFVQANNLIFNTISALLGECYVKIDTNNSILEMLKFNGVSPLGCIVNGNNNVIKMWKGGCSTAYTNNGTNNSFEVYTEWFEQTNFNMSGNMNVSNDFNVNGDANFNGDNFEIGTTNPIIYRTPTVGNNWFNYIPFQDSNGTEYKVLVENTRTELLTKPYINVLDYGAIGDGTTDDTDAIQNAVNAAGNYEHGAVVIFPPNHTFIVRSIVVHNDNVVLKGMGGLIKLKDNTFADPSTRYYFIVSLDNNNVWFVDLDLDGNAANNENFTVGDSITIAGGDNCRVIGCSIKNSPDSGIMFSNNTNSWCLNNYINDYRDCGIYCNKGETNNGKDELVCNNIIVSRTLGGVGSAIALKRSCNDFIVNNNIIRGGANGITLENASSATDYCSDITISGNRISDVSNYGINLRVSQRCNVIGNYIINTNIYGILVDGNSGRNSIIGNIISGQGGTAAIGFTIRDGQYPKYNVVSGNTVTASSLYGIYLSDTAAPGSQSIGNVLTNNNISNGVGDGLYVGTYYQHCIVANNFINGTTNDAVIKAANCEIVNNIFYNRRLDNQVTNGFNLVGVLGSRKIFSAASAATPAAISTSGDIILNSAPTGGGSVGWINVNGTWKSFGTIAS